MLKMWLSCFNINKIIQIIYMKIKHNLVHINFSITTVQEVIIHKNKIRISGLVLTAIEMEDLKKKKHLFLFIWLHRVLVVACGIQFPNQGSNPAPLYQEHRVLATGPQGNSQKWKIFKIYCIEIVLCRLFSEIYYYRALSFQVFPLIIKIQAVFQLLKICQYDLR